MDEQEKLISLLSELGVSTLSGHLGYEKTKRISEMGQEVSANTLAEVLIAEYGLNILSIQSVREDLLSILDIDKIKNSYSFPTTVTDPIKHACEFQWGNNEKTIKYLELIGINSNFIEIIKTDEKPIEEVPVKNILHPYQNWIRKNIIHFLNDSSETRIIVHMPTGSGKTRTCVESICDYMRNESDTNFSIVWFAHSEELCEQAAQSFKSMWQKYGSENAQLIRLWGGNRFDEIDLGRPTFVVTSFQTAYKMLSTSDSSRFSTFTKIRSTCKLLIVDEAHQSIAPTYKDAIELFSNINSKIIGLTATPGRHHINSDPENTVKLSEFYNNNKINIVDDLGNPLNDPIKYLTDKGVLSDIIHYSLNSQTSIVLTESERRHIEKLLDIPSSVLKKLGEDANRTNLIVTNALKLTQEQNMPTIIFAPSKESAVEISTMMKLRGCKSKAITGETNKYERREAIDQYKNNELMALVNFGVLTTGFDAPNTKAVIIARPTTSVVLYSQMIGRGLRGPLMGGNEACHLVDVIDNIQNMPDVSDAFKYFDEYY